MSLSYQVYGLNLRANRPIPGLIPEPETKPADVYVELSGAQPCQPPPSSQPVWPPESANGNLDDEAVKLWKADDAEGVYFHLRYALVGEYADFLISGDGSRVRVTWSERAPLNDITALLTGTPLGCVLRLRGVTCLHASAVAVGGVAVAILGAKGAGKSTTVAALAQRGHPVLTDDVVALVEDGERFSIQPGPLVLRLWPDAATALYGSAEELPPLWEKAERSDDKRYVDLAQKNEQLPRQPLPLAAIYVLEERQRTVAAPSVEPVSAADSLIALMTNTYAEHITDQAMRARDFRVLSRAASAVPLRRVHRPDALTALPQLCDAILTDVQAITNRG